MDAKVFYFVEGDGLVFGGGGVRGDVFLGVGAEGADVDFAGGDGAVGVDLGVSDRRSKWIIGTGWELSWCGGIDNEEARG